MADPKEKAREIIESMPDEFTGPIIHTSLNHLAEAITKALEEERAPQLEKLWPSEERFMEWICGATCVGDVQQPLDIYRWLRAYVEEKLK